MLARAPVFQSTLPGWGATGDMFHRFFDDRDISIHAPRMGSDGYFIGCPKFIIRISIHAPRMGSDRHAHARMGARRSISIHAPRMGSDQRRIQRLTPAEPISIHAPRMGSDNLLVAAPDFVKRFQSTLPGWGATSATACWNKCTRDFNPRSPDGERLGCLHDVPAPV